MPKRLLLIVFVVLFVLHQDFWLRDNPRLIFGVLPVSLAYHVGWTAAVALAWYFVTRFAWPDEPPPEPSSPGQDSPAGKPGPR